MKTSATGCHVAFSIRNAISECLMPIYALSTVDWRNIMPGSRRPGRRPRGSDVRGLGRTGCKSSDKRLPGGSSKKKKKDLADTLAWHMYHVGKFPECIREHIFHPTRKWRFDLAWPDKMIAIEVHGGEWIGGRHVTGSGLKADCEKTRAAMLLGWKVFPYTGSEVTSGVMKIIEEMSEVLDAKAT
jgi:hypothetical protein